MEAMARQSWTDDRLDERFDRLEVEVGQRFKGVEGGMKAGFGRVDRELGALRNDTTTLRKEMRADNAALRAEIREETGTLRNEIKDNNEALRKEIRENNAAMLSEFAALTRSIIQMGGAVIATVGGGLIIAVVGVLLTRL